MENKFHGLPPLKRFRLMQQEQQENNVLMLPCLPAKKRKESRDPPPLPPNCAATTTTYCLPAKKRIWAFQPNLIPTKPLSPIDLNVEYNSSFDEYECKSQESKSASNTYASIQIVESIKEEGDKIEDEDDGILCAICQSTDGDPLDPIVLCDGCDLMVHTTCYGYPFTKGVPEGDWFCTQCLISQSAQFQNHKALFCCLCPVSGGALKPTTDGRWAHVVCGLFVPEVFFSDPEGREGIDCTKVPMRRWEQSCYICNTVNGCAIDCSEPKCPLGFHVTCGLKEELCIEYREGRKKGAIVAGFCKSHTDLWKKQQETGKFKIVARDEQEE